MTPNDNVDVGAVQKRYEAANFNDIMDYEGRNVFGSHAYEDMGVLLSEVARLRGEIEALTQCEHGKGTK
jgi:hypothetical protein